MSVNADWIKMRGDLHADPRVVSMAEYLSTDDAFLEDMFCGWDISGTRAGQGCHAIWIRRTIACVVVASLLRVWSVVRHQGRRHDDDIVLEHANLGTVDYLAGFSRFGAAMESVGWVEPIDGKSLVFPKCIEHMTSPKEREQMKDTERKRRLRGRTSAGQGRDKTRDKGGPCPADVPPRVEKSREEENTEAETPSESCPETPKPASSGPATGDLMTFPTDGKQKTWNLNASKVAELAECFPSLDVLAECRKALQWLRENPGRRKTARGMGKFLLGWMSRAQERGGGGKGAAPSPKENLGSIIDRVFQEKRKPGGNAKEG